MPLPTACDSKGDDQPMTATLDTNVSAAPPLPVPASKLALPPVPLTPAQQLDREKRHREHDERVARWKTIAEAGGIDAWVRKQLQTKGVLVEGDPSKLSDAQKSGYKAKKKAEADERRVLRRQAWEAYHATHISHLGVGVHWEDRTDADKFDADNREERARSNDLPEIKTADDLAKALDVPVSRLRWLAFHRAVDSGTHYRRWSIPKRDGSSRTITAPKKALKTAQRWALRQVAEKLPVHGAAHGFLASRSIVTNAEVHAGADVLVKLDIKDFFPTVHWKRVKGLFRKAGLTEQVATLLALISTEAPREVVQFRGKTLYVATGPRALPQGAPTSPAITNAICMRLDRRMAGLARLLGFRYTRYADDLAFSWRAPDGATGRPRAPVGALLRGAREILRGEGFRPHPEKTRILRKGDRQRITGLVVNRAPEGVPAARVPRDVIRRLRAAIHNREVGKPGKEGETLAQIKGMAAFVHMTDPVKGRAFLDRIAALESKANGG